MQVLQTIVSLRWPFHCSDMQLQEEVDVVVLDVGIQFILYGMVCHQLGS